MSPPSDQLRKQRGDGEPLALTVNQKQRVNTCHIFLVESGTNTVKQTRRDASVVISRSFTINIPRRPFHEPLLLKLILSRRSYLSIFLARHEYSSVDNYDKFGTWGCDKLSGSRNMVWITVNTLWECATRPRDLVRTQTF